MPRLTFKQRFLDPRSPSRRPRRAAYALPTLFTAGNIFLGFIAKALCSAQRDNSATIPTSK